MNLHGGTIATRWPEKPTFSFLRAYFAHDATVNHDLPGDFLDSRGHRHMTTEFYLKREQVKRSMEWPIECVQCKGFEKGAVDFASGCFGDHLPSSDTRSKKCPE
jgi:hypothetical protein